MISSVEFRLQNRFYFLSEQPVGISSILPHDSSRHLEAWLMAARTGQSEPLGLILQICRHYLLEIANAELGTDLQAKAGGSDLVQQTFLEAQRDFGQFRGLNEGELRSWLRQILLNNVASFQRRFRQTEKRRVGKEMPLGEAEFHNHAKNGVVAPVETPSEAAMAHERREAVEQALLRLPEHYRQVLQLRQQEGMTFTSIGDAMQRSEEAAQKMWVRALEQLEKELRRMGIESER
jgi:RNA polymerase sigma-70 factor (ECF subfamily)